MPNSKIRIKDIAEKAGVSTGTVDRVLHNRPNVSPEAKEKVEAVLKEIDYQPNLYASALAYNKSYTVALVVPSTEPDGYWTEIEEGCRDSAVKRSDFNFGLKVLNYKQFSSSSFTKTMDSVVAMQPDGVILVPSTLENTAKYADKLHERNIPFVMIDSYMPDLQPLSYFGQDSFKSGYFAARMLMMIASKEKEIMIMKHTMNGRGASKQQVNRATGFRHYMHDHFPKIQLIDLNLPVETDESKYDKILEKFYMEHPNCHHAIAFHSRAYYVAEFLQRTNRRNYHIMGYDMTKRNARCVQNGSISFLIAQHGYMQGYQSVKALFKALVLKQEVAPVNYMPIEILTKENVEFYRRIN